ncbi:MAG: DUF4270 family protein [Muribaculaceae bacterium]|nr:DUF4270 family protein [Muribaculaceae bacterium]
MRHSFCMLLATAVLLIMGSCTDENIGVSITDSVSSVIEDSSFVITGHSVRNPRVRMSTTSKMLGRISSDGYGRLTAEAITMWMPAMNIDTAGVKSEWIDSCRLKLRVPVSDGFTGDSLAPMRLSVYRLNKALPSPIYSDFDPTGYYDPNALLTTESYSPLSGWLEVSTSYLTGTAQYDTVRVISVPMPVEIGRELFNIYREHPERFESPNAFADIFPGIYITNSYGSGHVVNIKGTELDVYYRKHVQLSDTTDTIYPAQAQSYLASTPEVVSDNIIRYDVDDALTELADNGAALIVAPAGYEVQLHFPIQDIIDKFKANVGTNQAIINTLSLELPVTIPPTQYDIQPPTYLLMVKTSKKDQFINGDSLTNNKDSFYALYDASTKSYTFGGLRNYVRDIIQNHGGIATEEDMEFTITPVDVTTYTYPASYSYYYTTTSSSIVTKISPMVSRPAVACLQLDKAKFKITYSKQIVD